MFEAYVALMDDDIREEVHALLSPCSDAEFLTAYQSRHKKKYGKELEI